MFDKRAERDAIRWGILDKMQSLEKDLSLIPGVVHVEFDIRDYGETRQVILVPMYDIAPSQDAEKYFWARREQLKSIIETCLKHGLYYSGDCIEDYGAHWYIVRCCNKTWPRLEIKKEDAT